MSSQVTRQHLTVEEYEHLPELTEDDRTELIDGEVIFMSPIGPRHAACVEEIQALLTFHVGRTAIVRSQSPIRLNDDAEPQPGLALLRWREDRYVHAHPAPADVLLLVEVADSTLADDRDVKLPRYARAGIPEVWLLNLIENTVELYTRPAHGLYQTRQVLLRGETFTSPAVPGLIVQVAGILL